MSAQDQSPEAEGRNIWDAIAPGRACGECTVCCVSLQIEFADWTKPVGTPCRNLCETGCSIYPVRPEVCRSYHCLWRRIGEIPDELRPDRSGVTASFETLDGDPFLYRCIIVRETGGPGSLDKALAKQLIRFLADAGRYPVWVSRNGNARLVHPVARVAEMVRGERKVPPAMRTIVERWRDYQKI